MIVLPSAEETRLLAVERRYERFDRALRDLARDIRRLQQGMREASDGFAGGGSGIEAIVRDATTLAAIPGATVDVKTNPGGLLVASGTTLSNGAYLFLLAPGTYDLTASAPGYASNTATGVSAIADAFVSETIYLTSSGALTSCCGSTPVPSTLTLVDPYGTNLTATFDGTSYWVACATYTTPGDASCSSITTPVRYRLSTACVVDVMYPTNVPIPPNACPIAGTCGAAVFSANAATRSGAPTVVCSPFSLTQTLTYNSGFPGSPKILPPTGRGSGVTFHA